ncbi:MAG: SDR family oxidoreductase [Rhodanobacter sp.]|nr:MAG: SDR family oxidoreductase [Rhodanobacter sp.]
MTEISAQRVAGKKAFVTGAAGGLGAAIARMLARHGARVFLTDIDEAAVRAVAASINAGHGATVAWAAMQNVRDEERWQSVLAEADAAMGGLSVLVNNAGIDVRSNSVHPAFIRTGIVEPFFAQLGEQEALRKLTRGIPLKRLGEADDVAHAVLYLASDESRYVTAAEIRVDGGASAV